MDVAEGITFLGVELVLIALMLLPVFQSNLFIAIMTSTAIGLAHGIGRALVQTHATSSEMTRCGSYEQPK
jgi:hypothetical protein